MADAHASNALRWFRRIMWLGILSNLALALPTLAMPERMMQLAGLPEADPLLWPRFAALLLILLSVFYMPAAIDPARYRASAWLAVGARLVGVVFFLMQDRTYHVLGYFDLIFFVPEFLLLWAAGSAGAVATAPAGAVRP